MGSSLKLERVAYAAAAFLIAVQLRCGGGGDSSCVDECCGRDHRCETDCELACRRACTCGIMPSALGVDGAAFLRRCRSSADEVRAAILSCFEGDDFADDDSNFDDSYARVTVFKEGSVIEPDALEELREDGWCDAQGCSHALACLRANFSEPAIGGLADVRVVFTTTNASDDPMCLATVSDDETVRVPSVSSDPCETIDGMERYTVSLERGGARELTLERQCSDSYEALVFTEVPTGPVALRVQFQGTVDATMPGDQEVSSVLFCRSRYFKPQVLRASLEHTFHVALTKAEPLDEWSCEDDLMRCSDGEDNDGDGKKDCQSVTCAAFCGENDLEACSDGVDNDDDTLTDCADFECGPFVEICESSVEACRDGIDNDGDAAIDCEAQSCAKHCENSVITCHDGINNDADLNDEGDCEDPSCAAFCELGDECSDGEDNDGDDAIDDDDPDCHESSCADGLDNDVDGLKDCEDPDCADACRRAAPTRSSTDEERHL